ncbi:hypothetical protein AVDCRST_MAG94-4862 [uncultured Leptolyngbya sp.]|uniref:Uncharacterized protein n=1 Tax=uncultured Leptolyngbya sp. TaxID=332963 RepID=A0A6J4NER3_9CYAN|nr:hypothetical protein AVDCRST_MAG94-4862 [uncultured Leptolyngbya sp.]
MSFFIFKQKPICSYSSYRHSSSNVQHPQHGSLFGAVKASFRSNLLVRWAVKKVG